MNIFEYLFRKTTPATERMIERGLGYQAREAGIRLDWSNLNAYSPAFLEGYAKASAEFGGR